METVNLTQLTIREGGNYLFGETPFSGFAIETFPDGRLRTQMPLMRGLGSHKSDVSDKESEMSRDVPFSGRRDGCMTVSAPHPAG